MGNRVPRPDQGALPPRRNFRLAITIALLVFATLIGVRVLWSGLGGRHAAPTLPPAQEAPAPTVN